MIITIHKGQDKTYVMLGSKDKRFREEWGDVVRIPVTMIYTNLKEIATWCDQTLKEACLFTIN